MKPNSSSGRTPEVSFITCVSDRQLYERCVVASLGQMNCPDGMIQRIAIDNHGNRYSAAQALNLGRTQARGALIVFCHQDVIFPRHWMDCLLEKIKEINQKNASWAIIGLAGRGADGSRSGHVDDPHGRFFYPPLPQKVQTLDELCLITRQSSTLEFDEYLDHYHLYGADLCLTAVSRDLSCYTIDCCLQHLSGGVKGDGWHDQKEKLINKWWPKRHIVGKKIWTTSGSIRLHSPAVRIFRRIRDHWRFI